MKLSLMVFLPLLGLLAASGEVLYANLRAMRESESVHRLSAVCSSVGGLVHEIQKERGLSSGFVGSGGTRFAAEIASQRLAVDAKARDLERVLAVSTAQDGSTAVKELATRLDEQLATIRDLRSSVSGLSVRPAELVERYASGIASMLGSLEAIAAATTEATVARRFTAFLYLQFLKEQVGIERASLAATFAADKPSPAAHEALLTTLARQELYERLSLAWATPEERDLYRKKVGGAVVDEVARLERVVLERAVKGSFGVDSEQWFRAASAKIDLLGEVDAVMANDMVEASENLRQAAARSFTIFGILTAVISILSVLGLVVVGRSISQPLLLAGKTVQDLVMQVVASVTQQSTTTNETATSVSETTTTVEEIRQTSQMTTEKARTVVSIAERSAAASAETVKSVGQGLEAMRRIRTEVESIAQSMLHLSEKNIRIGEIVQTVNAIAEQSNLLAVNASIEAAKAGEQGKGFGVVAIEVKALSGQSKEATEQIRLVLGEIQKSSNAAVMVTEQGSKRVEEGIRIVDGLGQSITALLKVLEQSGDASNQIAAAANQQLVGVDQIAGAMRAIEQATRDNAVGAKQLEKVAGDLRSIAGEVMRVATGRTLVQ